MVCRFLQRHIFCFIETIYKIKELKIKKVCSAFIKVQTSFTSKIFIITKKTALINYRNKILRPGLFVNVFYDMNKDDFQHLVTSHVRISLMEAIIQTLCIIF